MNDNKDTLPAGYEVLLCVTGGIACYKAADLTSRFVRAGAGVTVAMTESAGRFVGPITFHALSARRVYTSLWLGPDDYKANHISLTQRADLLIVAPATADIIAKIVTGLADDLVSATVLAAHGTCDILVAPSMNTRMWNAPPTQSNMARLRDWGVNIVGPAKGRLASGEMGEGRMSEPEEIIEAARKILLSKPPKGG